MKHRRRHLHASGGRPRSAAPVLYGFDAELGNSVVGLEYPRCTSGEAARALLAEIVGCPSDGYRYDYAPFCWGWTDESRTLADQPLTEYGRKYLSNGDCVYIDLEHLELCLAERLDCFQFPAALHASLARVERARQDANARLPAGREILVFANNSDGQGNSYGSHLSFLLPRSPRPLWDEIFHLKSLYLPYLASLQAAMIVLTGQGKVGAENGRPPVDFQIAQRPDFFVTLSSLETTSRRGLVNSRRESLCGRDFNDSEAVTDGYDRLHVIFFDWNLMPVAAILKCGLMQLILAGMRRGLVRSSLILDSPVEAAVQFSHDPDLGARAPLFDGREFTAVEILCALADALDPLVRSGDLDDLVPRAADIMRLLADTLAKLRMRDFEGLAGRLDWVLKRMLLRQEMDRDPRLSWRSPEIKHLDQMYSGTGPDGLFYACARAGLVERMPSESAIQRAANHPPEDTRAWTRGNLLRIAGRWAVRINWDSVAFQAWEDANTCRYWRVDLADPTRFTRREAQSIFRRATDLDALFRGLNLLHAEPVESAASGPERSAGPAREFQNVPDRHESGGTDEPADHCPTPFHAGGDDHA